jgi:hypothetical protein
MVGVPTRAAARVARSDAGGAGRLVRGLGTVLRQGPIHAELGAEVDGEPLERAERGAGQPLGEGVCG